MLLLNFTREGEEGWARVRICTGFEGAFEVAFEVGYIGMISWTGDGVRMGMGF